jgi:hypothetical protein
LVRGRTVARGTGHGARHGVWARGRARPTSP